MDCLVTVSKKEKVRAPFPDSWLGHGPGHMWSCWGVCFHGEAIAQWASFKQARASMAQRGPLLAPLRLGLSSEAMLSAQTGTVVRAPGKGL